METPNSTACLSFDFDAMSAWFGGDVTPAMLYRGERGAGVGVPRILAFLAGNELPATFFAPGRTAESFPRAPDGHAATLRGPLPGRRRPLRADGGRGHGARSDRSATQAVPGLQAGRRGGIS